MWLSIAVGISTFFTIVLFFIPTQKYEGSKDCSVQVVVLGDIGRSPRMQYHALSIVKHGGNVQLIGYLDTTPLPELVNHPNVSLIGLPPTPRFLQTSNRTPFLAFAPLKVAFQFWFLWQTLGYRVKPSRWMLIQNPPSIPTLLIASLVCLFRRTRLVIDWHNFGYSILALKLGAKHPLVTISEHYEIFFARFATANLTVTDAMAKVLRSKSPSTKSILTLYDRPAELYQPLSESQRLAFLQRYNVTSEYFNNIVDKKTRLVVSSTSWTADEDFGLFLDALCRYSATATSTHPQLPELLVIITGKGPLQALYKAKIQDLKSHDALEMVKIYTDWLSFEDYALLLGSADVGVSLHTSSSGVDLPMKVVDMFGAGLPVLGWSAFAAWPELVTEDINGKGFVNDQDMASIICDLFDPESRVLARLKAGAIRESKRRWDREWDSVAGKLFGFVN